tara:strand:- start:21587 stop:21970 length:384 start_codon:yes stop_codon:yes gene_type:complete
MLNNSKKIKYLLDKFIFISIGASIGALIRWHVGNILLLNVIGTLILGFVIGTKLREPFKLLLGVGFCGSLTTFSSWIINCLHLLIIGNFLQAIISITYPLIAGLIVISIGFFIGERFKMIYLNNSFF